jgi:hypothetical protein
MTVVTLSKSYTVHEKSFSMIEFREWTGADYWAVGKIEEWQPAGGQMALIRHHDRVKEYAERLMVLPQGWNVAPVSMLAVLNGADTLKVERAIIGFFTEAERSSRPPTSSSGEQESPSATLEA